MVGRRKKARRRSFRVSVCDRPYRPGDPRRAVSFNETEGGKRRYRVYLFLEGPDLPFVRAVKYTLHSSFRSPERVRERTAKNPSCELPIWVWGKFQVIAEIEDSSGRIHRRRHMLQYDQHWPEDRSAFTQAE